MSPQYKYPIAAFVAILCLIDGSKPTQAQNISAGGFVSTGYLESSHYNYLAETDGGTYEFVELALNASWTPVARTTVNGQLFAFELGRYGNYDPTIDYLFVDYSVNKEFGIQAGRIKREFGIYNHVQDIDVSRTSILLPLGMYDQRYRDFSAALDGVTLYGSLDLPNSQRFTYNLYGGDAELDHDGGYAGFGLTEVSRTTIDNQIIYLDTSYNYGGQFWYHPDIPGLRIGLGISYYPDIDFGTRGVFPNSFPDPSLAGKELLTQSNDINYTFTQASIEYFVGDWNFTGEVLRSNAIFSLEQSIGGFAVSNERTNLEDNVWYVSASRRFGKIEAGLTYTEMPLRGTSSAGGDNTFQEDRQLSLRYDATDFWTLKIEVHSMTGTKRLFNQYGQNLVIDEDAWTLWAAKSTFSF